MRLAWPAVAAGLLGRAVGEIGLLRRQLRDAASSLAPGSIVALHYRGTLDGDGITPLSLLYVGQEAHAREFELYLGGDEGRAPPAPDILFRGNLLDLLARARLEPAAPDADVIVRQAFYPTAAAAGELIHLPFLDGALPVEGSIEAQIQRVRSKAHRRRLRNARRSRSYAWRVTTDIADFESFYSTMYEPYVRGKFGLRAHLDSRVSLRELFRRIGRILLVTHGNETICGSLLFQGRGGILHYHRNGFAGGASLPRQRLAERTAALELALMEHAAASRARFIDLGFTRAILSDGLFIHKRRLGCTFEPSSYAPLFRLRFREAKRPAIFARFPLPAGARGSFVAHVGYPQAAAGRSVREWRGVVKNYVFPGLVRIVVHTDADPHDPGRLAYETALRQIAGSAPLVAASVVRSG